ncbi:ribose 5-phosphate isomerase B [Ileibacterium valens]|uniref:ribose 5-phosphate isomerase B n=1 Tax=Ileibacterium valens TaxID=1862668 RepID=UPI00272B9F73|nr:ribose 5-phosphate isomerase B [Ileibacterium valens]
MIIAVGCDHIVTEIKDDLKKLLESKGHQVLDVGTFDKKRTHYPIYGRKAAHLVTENKADRAIVLCGTGVGISNAANKVNGIRCVLASDPVLVQYARKNLDANVLAFGGRVIGPGMIEELVDVFLETPFEENKQADLIRQIDQLRFETDLSHSELFDPFLKDWEAGNYHD